MKKLKNAFRKLIALLVGLPIVVAGIILIPLPGPGVLLTLLGLFVLSFGFDEVKRPLETYRQKLNTIYKNARRRYDRFVDDHNLNDEK